MYFEPEERYLFAKWIVEKGINFTSSVGNLRWVEGENAFRVEKDTMEWRSQREWWRTVEKSSSKRYREWKSEKILSELVQNVL